ncbi:MAG TPA: hypothetical protein VG295_14530 [Solirubrobacteraceae bacterium]|nr:hypothetical protein [Solirubrobacteraceae bacterium]
MPSPSPRRRRSTITAGRRSGWAGRSFATLWDDEHMNVMVDPDGIRTAVGWWGKRLAAVHVTLARADARLLSGLLAHAWERRAPQRLLP